MLHVPADRRLDMGWDPAVPGEYSVSIPGYTRLPRDQAGVSPLPVIQ